ncbi:MAG TPA: S41 family peptidase [Stellaceae bacterium]|nr:S41 family peptidase [Stellaceae bacterium]
MRLLKLAMLAALIGLLPFASPSSVAAPDTGDSVNINLFNEILDQVKGNYVEPVTEKHLIEGAIKGMLASLDPHSGYLDAKQYHDMMVETEGEFGGLGMQVTEENGLVKVISPIDDTPAARAGIKPGDLILAIDGAPVTDMMLSEAVDKLRGAIGTKVKLTIRRRGVGPFELSLTRADIRVAPVKFHLADGDIGYVRITSFSERASSSLEQAIDKMKQQAHGKLVGIVLDLRNNPGGLLDQAVAVANDFLDRGSIVSIKGRQPQDNRIFDAKANGDLVPGLPVVVLINGGSASASEIVAGALHDDHRAVLLGTRSFGKGSVQTVLPVKQSNGAIRLTTALYYTPSGRSIQGKGIEPDVVVEPAKIEKVAVGPQLHEADLRGALKNDTPAPATAAPKAAPGDAAAPTAAPPATSAKLPPGATPLPKSDATALDSTTLGTDADYQFVRAVDLLRGVTLFKNLAVK